jgi:hypothetical protein
MRSFVSSFPFWLCGGGGEREEEEEEEEEEKKKKKKRGVLKDTYRRGGDVVVKVP